MSELKQAPLEDLMAAMDVVDTLRHQQNVAERELNSQQRRARMLTRLKDLYQAQGIEVSDHILQEGILALEEERFKYTPVESNWATKVAGMWVSRGRWGKPIGFLAVIASLFYGYYFVSDVMPARALMNELPVQLQSSLTTIESVAKDPALATQARQQHALAQQAIQSDNVDTAQAILVELSDIAQSLQQHYMVRVVSSPNQSSGVWRIPDINTNSRNYYLIVEAVDNNDVVLELPILNEESNQRELKKQWGLRVNEDTFYKIAQDKQDDGIIQSNTVGEKKVGYMRPDFSIPTTGGTITEW